MIFYIDQGFSVAQGPAQVETAISNSGVEVIISADFAIGFEEDNTIVKNHNVGVPTSLGKLYSSALRIYEKEQTDMFLEAYGIDVMNLYAPVTGVELSCGPLNWDAEEVFDDLSIALEANTQAIRTSGDDDDYFYVDVGVSESVRFLNSRNWSSAYEVNPSEGRFMIAMPIGNQPGLGIMGFCYVPYHFVYNIRYPVMIQVYEGSEIFQFPMSVVILGNKAREPLTSIATEGVINDFCDYKNTGVEVEVVDFRGSGVEADISYECSGTSCYIGKALNGNLVGNFPQCAGGRIIARAEGYKETSMQFSSVETNFVTVAMDKFYELDVNVLVDGRDYAGEAIVSFNSNETSKTVLYPEQETIELVAGEYEVTVYIYSNASLKLEESVSEQCVEVPKGGVGGLIGLTEQRCFAIEMPEQIISQALSAGGHSKVYLLDSRLSSSSGVYINSESLPEPTSLEQLQTNYVLFEDKIVEVSFR